MKIFSPSVTGKRNASRQGGGSRFKRRKLRVRAHARRRITHSLGEDRARRRDRRRVSAFKKLNRSLCVMKILEKRNDSNAPRTNQVGLESGRRLGRWFFLRILCAADAFAEIARMLAIEGARNRLRQRRSLLRICYQHRRPRNGLKSDPIESHHETKDEDYEAATDYRRHGHNATRSRVHRSTSEAPPPLIAGSFSDKHLKTAAYALLKTRTRSLRWP